MDTDYPFTVGNDGPGTYNNEKYDLIFNMDDLFIFNKAFGTQDMEALRRYYNFKSEIEQFYSPFTKLRTRLKNFNFSNIFIEIIA